MAKAFISHNKADKKIARALSEALLGLGIDPLFDEWEIAPGESLIAWIGQGIGDCDVFVLVWSMAASRSNWVGTELRAALRRRVEDDGLRVVPVIVDNAPLPTLVADYKGFDIGQGVEKIACEIAGSPKKEIVIKRLHSLLMEKLHGSKPLEQQPLAIFCERCYSSKLTHRTQTDEDHDRMYYLVSCQDCDWYDWTEL